MAQGGFITVSLEIRLQHVNLGGGAQTFGLQHMIPRHLGAPLGVSVSQKATPQGGGHVVRVAQVAGSRQHFLSSLFCTQASLRPGDTEPPVCGAHKSVSPGEGACEVEGMGVGNLVHPRSLEMPSGRNYAGSEVFQVG